MSGNLSNSVWTLLRFTGWVNLASLRSVKWLYLLLDIFLHTNSRYRCVAQVAKSLYPFLKGAEFKTYGPYFSQGQQDPLFINTGLLKVHDVQSNVFTAEVIQDGTTMSANMFPRFPGIMAGDIVIKKVQRITASPMLAQKIQTAGSC